jgi:hypothetical protein
VKKICHSLKPVPTLKLTVWYNLEKMSFKLYYQYIIIIMPTKILSSSPYVNTLSAKQIVNFQRKALANRQVISQEPSLLQSNSFTVNPIELEIQKFVNLSQKIMNDVEYLNSTIDYHSKSSFSTPLPKRVEMEMEQPPPVDEDPFLDYQDIYTSPFQDEPIMATPVKMRKTLSVERKIDVLRQRIYKTKLKIDQYQEELASGSVTKKRVKQLEANILRNMESLENLTNELNELTGPTCDSDDEDMEETGGAMDSQSQIIKTANNLIYLLREADLAINTKLFPVARILNPIQKETLRRCYHELRDSLNTIPPIPNAKIDVKLTEEIQKFEQDLSSIL